MKSQWNGSRYRQLAQSTSRRMRAPERSIQGHMSVAPLRLIYWSVLFLDSRGPFVVLRSNPSESSTLVLQPCHSPPSPMSPSESGLLWSFEEQDPGIYSGKFPPSLQGFSQPTEHSPNPWESFHSDIGRQHSFPIEGFASTQDGPLHQLNMTEYGSTTTNIHIQPATNHPRPNTRSHSEKNCSQTYSCVEMQYCLHHMQKPKCNGVEAPVMSEVRRHLKRRPHKLSELERCQVCDEDFLSREDFKKHEQPYGPCEKRKLSPVQQWGLLYAKVNNTEETPPSPYNGMCKPYEPVCLQPQPDLQPPPPIHPVSQQLSTSTPSALGLTASTSSTDQPCQGVSLYDSIFQQTRDLVVNLTQSLPEEERRDTRYRVGAGLMFDMNASDSNAVEPFNACSPDE